MARTYSAVGLSMTGGNEGLVLTAYKDPVGILTIGYGHTGKDVVAGLTITQEQAEHLLAGDVASAVACVNRAVTKTLNQNQFDALVDFTFNCGSANFLGSTLLKKVNAGDFTGAALEFGNWIYAKKKVLPGLVKRRAEEEALFTKSDVSISAGGEKKRKKGKKKAKKGSKKKKD